jgi:hypothetical protein
MEQSKLLDKLPLALQKKYKQALEDVNNILNTTDLNVLRRDGHFLNNDMRNKLTHKIKIKKNDEFQTDIKNKSNELITNHPPNESFEDYVQNYAEFSVEHDKTLFDKTKNKIDEIINKKFEEVFLIKKQILINTDLIDTEEVTEEAEYQNIVLAGLLSDIMNENIFNDDCDGTLIDTDIITENPIDIIMKTENLPDKWKNKIVNFLSGLKKDTGNTDTNTDTPAPIPTPSPVIEQNFKSLCLAYGELVENIIDYNQYEDVNVEGKSSQSYRYYKSYDKLKNEFKPHTGFERLSDNDMFNIQMAPFIDDPKCSESKTGIFYTKRSGAGYCSTAYIGATIENETNLFSTKYDVDGKYKKYKKGSIIRDVINDINLNPTTDFDVLPTRRVSNGISTRGGLPNLPNIPNFFVYDITPIKAGEKRDIEINDDLLSVVYEYMTKTDILLFATYCSNLDHVVNDYKLEGSFHNINERVNNKINKGFEHIFNIKGEMMNALKSNNHDGPEYMALRKMLEGDKEYVPMVHQIANYPGNYAGNYANFNTFGGLYDGAIGEKINDTIFVDDNNQYTTIIDLPDFKENNIVPKESNEKLNTYDVDDEDFINQTFNDLVNGAPQIVTG